MRYWLTEHEGTGVVPATPHHALSFGLVVHDGLYWLGKEGLDKAIDVAVNHEEYARLSDNRQQAALGLLYGFATRVWPDWMEQYDVVALEQELEFEEDGVLFMCRPDVLLRSKSDGTLWYPDFKTFARWSNRKWNYALQQQLSLLAIERSVGEKIAGAWIQGLYKGTERSGNLYHPLVNAYRRPENPGVSPAVYSPGRKAGFERFNIASAYPGGQEAWARQLGQEEIAKCFPRTVPFFRNERMLNAFLAQRTQREAQIKVVSKNIRSGSYDEQRVELNSYFPQHFAECETAYSSCPYLDACWVPSVNSDPVGSGLFVPRTPHHEAEVEIWKKQEKWTRSDERSIASYLDRAEADLDLTQQPTKQ